MIFDGIAFKKLKGLCVGILKFFPIQNHATKKFSGQNRFKSLLDIAWGLLADSYAELLDIHQLALYRGQVGTSETQNQ